MSITWDRNRRTAGTLLEAVGATPLVRLGRVAPDVELFAKVEWYGPTGSVKDRIYAKSPAASAKPIIARSLVSLPVTSANQYSPHFG